MTDLDPTEVPAYPRVLVQLTRDGRAFVNREQVTVAKGQDPAEAAFEAVVENLKQRGTLGAVRVAAIDAHGREWPMVVAADGRRWDLSALTPGRAGRRPWLLPGAAAAAVVVIASIVVGAVLLARSQTPDPTLTDSSGSPTAQPTEFPMPPPDGWTTRARWASGPLASDRRPARIGTQAVAVLTNDDRIEVRDLHSGVVRWADDAPRGVLSGPHVTRLGTQDVLAVATDTELTWWPLSGADEPTKLELPDDAEEVTFTGRSPMVIRPDQHVSVPDFEPNTWRDRVIPAGAVALGNDEGRVIAATTTGQWWVIDTEAQIAPPPYRLSGPYPISRLVGVAGYAAGQLLTVWVNPDGATRVGMHDTITGRPTVWAIAPRWPAGATKPETQLADGFAVVADRVLADTHARRLRPLPEGWSTEAVLTDRAYGEVTGSRQLIGITGPARAITSETYPTDIIEDPTGDTGNTSGTGSTGDTALTFAQVSNRPILYALTKGTEIEQPTPVPATTPSTSTPGTPGTPRPTGQRAPQATPPPTTHSSRTPAKTPAAPRPDRPDRPGWTGGRSAR